MYHISVIYTIIDCEDLKGTNVLVRIYEIYYYYNFGIAFLIYIASQAFADFYTSNLMYFCPNELCCL